MKILRHCVENFRNLSHLEFTPGPGINVIFGRNGEGKTNLLESLFYTATLRSFRKAKRQSLLGPAGTTAFLETAVQRREGAITLAVQLSHQGNRLAIDGKERWRAREFFGHWIPVLFSPEDHLLAKLGPEYRRNYFDMILSFQNPAYLGQLAELKRVVQQKKKLLIMIAAGQGGGETLPAWNESLAQAAVPVMQARAALCRQTQARLTPIYGSLSDATEEARIDYAPSLEEGDYLAQLQQKSAEEREKGLCLLGPQRDNYRFRLAGRSLKDFASQGEEKTFLLALKILELQLAEQAGGEPPVLLIDDLGSELDPFRNRNTLALLRGGERQIFITTTDPGKIEFVPAAADRLFHLQKGVLSLV